VDLADTLNFLGSADLVDYAASRGWYDPEREKTFDFERAYAERSRRVSPHQRFRQWSGIRHLAPGLIPSPENGVPLPFSLKPDRRVRAEHLFAILRDHYEDSPYEVSPYRPHNPEKPLKARVICANSTNSGSVFVLRSDMPLEIGALWWLALCRPCTGPFLPLYLGLTCAPDPLNFEVEPEVYREPASAAPLSADKAYRVFKDLNQAVDKDYAGRIGKVRPVWEQFERTSFTIQQALEQEVRSNWYGNHQFMMEAVERICQGTAARAVQQARAFKEEF
jgi:dipeptidase